MSKEKYNKKYNKKANRKGIIVMDLTDKREGKKEDKKEDNKGLQNLIPFNELSEEEHRAIARRGGLKSAEVRKARKTGREIAQQLLAMEMSDDQIDDVLADTKSILGNDKSVYAVMQAKMIQCANMGDVKAATFIRDTAGDKPDDKIQLETDAITDGDRELLRNVADTLAGMGVNITKPNDEV